MGGLRLALVLLEGEEGEDAAEVRLCHVRPVHVFVGKLCKGSHCVLCSVHAVRREGIIAPRDSLDESGRAGEHWREGFPGEDVGESAQTIRDGVEDVVALSVLFISEHFEELLGDLSHGCSIICDARVVDDVAPEAEDIQ